MSCNRKSNEKIMQKKLQFYTKNTNFSYRFSRNSKKFLFQINVYKMQYVQNSFLFLLQTCNIKHLSSYILIILHHLHV